MGHAGDFSFRVFGVAELALNRKLSFPVSRMWQRWVGEPIEQRGGHFGIAEYLGPFAEAEIGDDDGPGALVEFAEQVEQQRAA